MKSIESPLSAAISLVWLAAQFLLATPVTAVTNPKYGGTLRVELHASTAFLDPRSWRVGSLEFATEEKLASLVFERLVSLDSYGRFQPVLATEWSHDGAAKRWQFAIRAGVKFSDGAPLTPADVAAALQPLLPESLQILASGNAVVIQSANAAPDLLEQLAYGRYFVYRVAVNGALVGTGPFVAAESPADAAPRTSASHLTFRANEEAWSGRPFLDAIEITLAVPPLRAMFDLQLGKADLIELAPDLVPRASQANLRIWTSDSVAIYGLRFDNAQTSASDARLREALALSLDRAAIANVLLQRQAQPAAALLPQWLSGYAFLFNVDTNLERAKELRHALPPNVAGGAEPLRLRVDAAGDLAKLLGERVAVNARQAAILVQVVSKSPAAKPAASSNSSNSSTSYAPPRDPPAVGLHLFAWRYSSLSPRAELDSLLAVQSPPVSADDNANASSTDQEQLFARERKVLEDWRVVPLIEQAESVGLGANVRNWMPARWGEWHLADVWLERAAANQAESSGAIKP